MLQWQIDTLFITYTYTGIPTPYTVMIILNALKLVEIECNDDCQRLSDTVSFQIKRNYVRLNFFFLIFGPENLMK